MSGPYREAPARRRGRVRVSWRKAAWLTCVTAVAMVFGSWFAWSWWMKAAGADSPGAMFGRVTSFIFAATVAFIGWRKDWHREPLVRREEE